MKDFIKESIIACYYLKEITNKEGILCLDSLNRNDEDDMFKLFCLRKFIYFDYVKKLWVDGWDSEFIQDVYKQIVDYSNLDKEYRDTLLKLVDFILTLFKKSPSADIKEFILKEFEINIDEHAQSFEEDFEKYLDLKKEYEKYFN